MYAWRWQVVLAGMGFRVPYADVVRQYLVGLFFSNLMPTAVGGDAAKVFYLGRRIGFIEAGASVLVDRFLGFFWLAMLGAASVVGVGHRYAAAGPESQPADGNCGAVRHRAGVDLGRPGGPDHPVDRCGAAGSVRCAARFEELAGHVRDWRLPAGDVCRLRGGGRWPTCCCWRSSIARYFTAAGVTAPALLPTMNVIVSMSVFVNVPISVGGIGLREQLHYLLFAELGVPKEASVSLSLLIFAYSLALGLAGYVIWLRMKPATRGGAGVKTLVVLQPGYLPWLGFFDQMRRADVFVYYDDVQYDKHGWRNRNRVKAPDGPQWLTVPVRHHGLGQPRIMDAVIDPRAPWARKHVAHACRQFYAKAPHVQQLPAGARRVADAAVGATSSISISPWWR